jgi:hypothetical protein
MGPLTLPQMPQPKRKRRWKLFLLWSLLMFAGGVAAGVALIDPICGGLANVASTLGLPAPRFVANRRATAPASAPSAVPPEPAAASAPEPAPAPVADIPRAPEGTGQGQALAAKPAAIPAEAKPAPELAAPAPREPAPHDPKLTHHAVAATPARAEPAAEPERVPHGKGAAKTASSAGTSAKKLAKFDDPFASDGETANEAKPAAASGKAKAAPSEPAPRPTAKSNDSLDSLMADGVGDSKGKKRDSKDLDALLKDVQKSKPEPKAKHEEPPPPAAALSPSDISRVMAGVKTRSNDCAHRLGQKGNAELKITVGKDGRVSDVTLGGNVANTPLGACIEKATRAATFPASSGLRFDYRIDAR